MIIIMVGLPGSGKSTAAKLIAKKMNGVVLRSDEIRKELFALPSYSDEETAAVYQALFDRAKIDCADSHVILDATFSQRRHRSAAVKMAESLAVPLSFVLTVAPEALVRQRIALRESDASDAKFEQYLEKKAAFEPLREEHFRIDTAEDIESQIDAFIYELN